MLTSGIRAKDLVHQILTFARQTEQKFQPVHVSLIVKETLKLLKATLPKTVMISQKMECDALVLSNPSQIHQVFMNLCTNAIHAMGGRKGVLTVELSSFCISESAAQHVSGLNPGEYLRLAVSDTGCGIEPDAMEKIFVPYYTTKKKGKSTGLGLSVVHGIVNACGGAITVDSVLHKGTTFTVLFPITEKLTPVETPDPELLLTGTEKILIVEDELLIAALLRQVLMRQGYDVTVCLSSAEALEQFKKSPERFDLIITNLSMPQMRGDRLATEMLKIKPDLPVILCTGNRKKISPEQAKALGFHSVVVKPVVNPRPLGRGFKRVGRGLYPCQHPYFKETPALRPGSHPAGMNKDLLYLVRKALDRS